MSSVRTRCRRMPLSHGTISTDAPVGTERHLTLASDADGAGPAPVRHRRRRPLQSRPAAGVRLAEPGGAMASRLSSVGPLSNC